MKTPLLGKYVKKLANLNDQLCFFQFSRNELIKSLSNFGPKAKKLFTTDVFAQNPMAPSIHVTLNALEEFQIQNESNTFGAYISTSYEVTSYYLRDSLDFLSVINSASYQSSNNPQLEEKYIDCLIASSCTTIDREIVDTLKYIRLRRNHFTHLSDTLSNQLNTLIVNQGSILNNYWSNAINHLDFTATNILVFDEGETIEILKLLRIIVETLDKNLASSLSPQGLIMYLSKKEFENKPQKINQVVVETRIKRIQRCGEHEFGFTLNDNDIEPIVKVIGKK